MCWFIRHSQLKPETQNSQTRRLIERKISFRWRFIFFTSIKVRFSHNVLTFLLVVVVILPPCQLMSVWMCYKPALSRFLRITKALSSSLFLCVNRTRTWGLSVRGSTYRTSNTLIIYISKRSRIPVARKITCIVGFESVRPALVEPGGFNMLS